MNIRNSVVYVVAIALLLGLFPLWASSTTDEEVLMQELVAGNTAFALDMYAHLRTHDGNLFFSPYSISTALAMTYAGARGETEEQMAQVLHLTLEHEDIHPAFAYLDEHFRDIQRAGNVALSVANALWIQQGFNVLDAFLDTVKTYYRAGLHEVNFVEAAEAAREDINSWVAAQTNQKIQELIPQGVLHELTRLVLTNAIYFQGKWASEFSKDETQEDAFWVSSACKKMAPLMYQEHAFHYGENDDVQVIQMPYQGEDLSMAILLPKVRDGLAAIEASLTPEHLRAWLNLTARRDVKVYLPRFTQTSRFSLSSVLQAMGMKKAFSSREADFSGIEPGKSLSITDVLHKAFVEVNEEGTEAAAATGVVVGVTSVMEPQPVPVFRADHPFLFLIRDKRSGSILFMGRMMDPSE